MQDNITQERREALVERGWQSMAAMLDAEMPLVPGVENKKRRRVIWIWFLAAAGLLAGLVWMYRIEPHPAKAPKPAFDQSLPARAEVRAAQTAPAEEQEDVRETKSNFVSRRAEQAVQGVSGISQPPVLFVPGPLTIASGLSPEEILVWSDFDPPEIQSSNPEELVVNEPWIDPIAVQPVSPALPALYPIALNAPLATPEWAKVSTRRASKKVRFGAEMAAGIGAFPGVSSVAFGPVVSWQANPRLALQSGILIGNSRHKLLLGDDDNVNVSGAPHFGNTPLNVLAEQVSNGEELVLSARTLQVPVVLSYRVGSRFRVETGMTAGRVSKAKQVTTNLRAEDLSSGGPITSNSYTRAQLDQAIRSSLASWEFLFSAGLRYKISADWSVGLHYQRGVNDLLADHNLQARQQNLRLSGLLYF